VDLFRPRAIPALAFALAVAPVMAADCASLEGTYAFVASKAAAPGEPPESLSDFVTAKEGSTKLYRIDVPGGKASYNPGEPIRRGKSTPLATKATLKRSGARTTLQFMDAGNKLLLDADISAFGRWACKGERLERSAERVAGLGDSIRTERMDEVLERNAAGDLVHRTTIATLDPKGIKPVIREAVFPAVR
jgi:hypothetical protein